MTDDPIRRFLRARGVADHVVDGGLDGLVADWEHTAELVERGYALGLDDYLNDLDARQIIEVVLSAMPEPDGPLLARLRAADERMRRATVPAGRCVWGDPPSQDRATERRNWWYFLVPRDPGPELARELADAGFAGPR
jgi:hypothetical protein